MNSGSIRRDGHQSQPDLTTFADLDEHLRVASSLGEDKDFLAAINHAIQTSVKSLANGGKLLLCGNGGSAADCQHIATELTIRYTIDRPAIAAIALTTDTSALTAAGNDIGFERIFSRQVEALGRPGDVLIAVSTSGNSPNVLLAAQTARAMQIGVVLLSGDSGGRMADLADISILVPSRTTARIQEVHILVGHILCGELEKRLGFMEVS